MNTNSMENSGKPIDPSNTLGHYSEHIQANVKAGVKDQKAANDSNPTHMNFTKVPSPLPKPQMLTKPGSLDFIRPK